MSLNVNSKRGNEVEFLKKFNILKKYKKNIVIIEQGDESQYFFYLKSGYIRLYVTSNEGKELSVFILKPGSYFPVLSSFIGAPNIYTYESLTEVNLLKVPINTALEFVKNNYSIFLELTTLTLKRLDTISRLLIDTLLYQRNAAQQIILLILYLSTRFGINMQNNQVEIDFPLTHRIIGTLVGISREAASREIEKLIKGDFICFKGHKLIILNFKRLQANSLPTISTNISYNLIKL
jgi:CRP/FNR family cyclic AMP-dependent transcriptional regulator